MKLTITNSFVTAEKIREIIRFVKPQDISNFDISIKNSEHGYAGTAYTKGCSYHSTWAPLVVIRFNPKKIRFPYRKWKKPNEGYLEWTAYTAEEVLVQVIAHELRHLWQEKHPKGWRVWGARGKYSERDADAYAIQKVRAWRRRGINLPLTKVNHLERQIENKEIIKCQ